MKEELLYGEEELEKSQNQLKKWWLISSERRVFVSDWKTSSRNPTRSSARVTQIARKLKNAIKELAEKKTAREAL